MTKKVKKNGLLANLSPKLRWIAILVLATSNLLLKNVSCGSPIKTGQQEQIETCFTPEEPCMDLIVSHILSAKETILVQAYVLTSKAIVESLIQVHQKNVTVRLLVDKSTSTSHQTKIPLLLQSGIPIIIDKTTGLAHNKIIIIDDTCVLTGSFNWTHSAQHRNAENVVILKGKSYCKRFKENWHKRAAAGSMLPRY